jgi:thioredoxin-related protein
MKFVIAPFVLLFSISTQWLTDFNLAKETAAREERFILLNFAGSDWCGPCIQMKKEVFESKAFNELADSKLVLVRADFPRLKKNKLSKEQTAHNESLAGKYNPTGKFPLTLLLDSKGNVIRQWDGYAFGSRDKFLNELKTAISTK